jgi:predicted nucleic acid-binding protein
VAVKVIDASALGAVLFNEPDAGKVTDRLEAAMLAAPTLLPYEIASICLKKISRHPEDRELIVDAGRMVNHIDIAYSSFEMSDIIDLAEDTGLTVYDASYLYLAESIDAELVTLDRQLEKAALERT